MRSSLPGPLHTQLSLPGVLSFFPPWSKFPHPSKFNSNITSLMTSSLYTAFGPIPLLFPPTTDCHFSANYLTGRVIIWCVFLSQKGIRYRRSRTMPFFSCTLPHAKQSAQTKLGRHSKLCIKRTEFLIRRWIPIFNNKAGCKTDH